MNSCMMPDQVCCNMRKTEYFFHWSTKAACFFQIGLYSLAITTKTYVMGTQKSLFNETVIVGTQNTCLKDSILNGYSTTDLYFNYIILILLITHALHIYLLINRKAKFHLKKSKIRKNNRKNMACETLQYSLKSIYY